MTRLACFFSDSRCLLAPVLLCALNACTSSDRPPATRSDEAPACGPSSACSEGQLCTDGLCLTVCETAANCPSGAVCAAGRCHTDLGTDCSDVARCEVGQCVGGTCATPPEIWQCADSSDCPAETTCSRDGDFGACVHDPAPADAGAPDSGRVDPECPPSYPECRPRAECNSDGCTCPEPFSICYSEVCVALAVDPTNCGECGHACAEGQECTDGVCVTPR